jgi:hypothetical protein
MYDLPQTAREFSLLAKVVTSEMEARVAIFLSPSTAKYYEMILPIELSVAFTNASCELLDAGNCLALGQFTASVFHSMRAAEIGVRAMGASLNVKFPFPAELADWQNILDQIDTKIRDMKSLPKGTKKDEDIQFYSEAASQFRWFKDGWRVRVAHARAIYKESDARKVLDHTINFFETLSKRLME